MDLYATQPKSLLLKIRICSFWSKFFPLRVDPILNGSLVQGSLQEITKVVPLVKTVETTDLKTWFATMQLLYYQSYLMPDIKKSML